MRSALPCERSSLKKPEVKIGMREVPMNKVHHDELEGKVIELSLQWDEHAKEDIENDDPFLKQTLIYTPQGHPSF